MKKILIIEDNFEIRENTAELLELNDYKVFTAIDGNEGLTMARLHQPDLILCDIMMPKTDGRSFFIKAKQDILIKDIPVVFFSAGSSQYIQGKLKNEADGFLKKPFSEPELLGMIGKVLYDPSTL